MNVWIYDINHRVYEDDQGNKTTAPDYRKSWIKCEVIRETARSYVVRRYGEVKIPKNRESIVGDWVAFSEEELTDKIFKHDHAHKIAAKIQVLDAAKLRTVAELIGYEL